MQANGSVDPKLYVWDVELDTLQYFNFESGRGDQDEYVAVKEQNESDLSDMER